MSIKNLYPTQRPEIIYNVINGRNELPVNSTFSRASEATYVNSAGALSLAETGVPRFHYDVESGEFLGLLLEDSTPNYFYQSENLSSSIYVKDEVSLDGNRLSPLGDETAYSVIPSAEKTANHRFYLTTGVSGRVGLFSMSMFVKSDGYNVLRLGTGNAGSFSLDVKVDLGTETIKQSHPGGPPIPPKLIKYPDGWYKAEFCVNATQTSSVILWVYENVDYSSFSGDGTKGLLVWGLQMEPGNAITSYIRSYESNTSRAADNFSLTSSRNFDAGFSLLLDSQATTKDFIYKIKADGEEIASLSNNVGTLDWEINGKSAAINGEYPQVGFLPGRVRTISSFGPAGQGDVENYLYTTGISFPTTAEPAAGADEIEFGVPQTLKALYVWDGQLDETNAVSLIRGKYNVVPNEPIAADSYSFVYNTDPTNEGNLSITLPFIIPTVSMRVDWGDGNSNAYEKGIVSSHTYPYPGQYRIQIEADDGFDNVRLADVNQTITRVDQWAPQHRVGASGDGFTDRGVRYLLDGQNTCTSIPGFKYTDLTNLDFAFFNCTNLDPTTDWVPTVLPEVTSMENAFWGVGSQRSFDKSKFPQFETSDKLTNIAGVLYGAYLTGFVDKDGNKTLFPFTDTSNVTNWFRAFALNNFTEIGQLNTRSATTLSSTFSNCKQLQEMPFIETVNVTNFSSAWTECNSLASFPQITTNNGTDFRAAWQNCKTLPTFPNISLSSCNGTGLYRTWSGCSGLKSFPTITLNPAIYQLYETFNGCSGLETFPPIDTKDVTYFHTSFRSCTSLEEFPLLDISKGDYMYQTWMSCSALKWVPEFDFSSATTCYRIFYGCFLVDNIANHSETYSYPIFNMSNVGNLREAWAYNRAITSFPPIDWSSCKNFQRTWFDCSAMTTFPPNMFDNMPGYDYGDVFYEAFQSCALNAQSVENILVSIDSNGLSGTSDEYLRLSINGGTNADYSTWTDPAKDALASLRAKYWEIEINDSSNLAPASVSLAKYTVLCDENYSVSLKEPIANSVVVSRHPSAKTFDTEEEAIAEVLKIDADYFPAWNRETDYSIDDRVKFGTCIFRALQENDLRTFELPDLDFDPNAEIPTPMNRQARWKMVCNPEFEELTNEEESY